MCDPRQPPLGTKPWRDRARVPSARSSCISLNPDQVVVVTEGGSGRSFATSTCSAHLLLAKWRLCCTWAADPPVPSSDRRDVRAPPPVPQRQAGEAASHLAFSVGTRSRRPTVVPQSAHRNDICCSSAPI